MTGMQDFSFNRPWGRHWRMAAVVTAACVVLAGLLTQILPHRYESEMKFLINNKRADFVLTPGENQATAPPAEVSETEVNSEIELLRSHELLEEVVMDHKLYTPFESSNTATPSRKSIERATDKLAGTLSVSALRKTNIIDVTYRNADPNMAAAVLQDVGDRYLAYHLRAHGSHGSDAFFTEQVEQAARALAAARAELSRFHQRTELFSIPQQQTALVQRVADVSSRLEDVNAQVSVQQSRLAEGARLLSSVPERLVTQIRETSDQLALQQLEPTLAQLESRKIELLTKFLPTDRLVTQVDQQISMTRKELYRIRAERLAEQTTDVNALHQSIKSDTAKSAIDLRGLQAERLALGRMRQNDVRQLEELDRQSVELQELERVGKEAQDNYSLYTRRLDEARLAEALDRDKFSNVVMIERPAVSVIPVTPKLSLNLAAGLVFGLVLAAGVAFFREVRNESLDFDAEPTEAPFRHLGERPLHAASGD